MRIAHDPFRSVGNAVVWEAPDGLVWLFYVVRYGDTWSTSRVQAKVSRDQAETWSDASMLVLDEGTLVRNRPIVLNNGDYLLPLYHETGHDTESTGPDSYSFFLRYAAKDKTWTKTGPIRSPRGNIQPAVAQLSDREPGRLLPARGRLPARDHRLHRPLRVARRRLDLERGQGLAVPESQRGGRPPQAQERPAAAGLQPQHEPADAADAGPLARSATGPGRFAGTCVEGDNDYGYPIAFQSADGRIHVVYTSDRRTVVNHAVFDEDWVIHGSAR